MNSQTAAYSSRFLKDTDSITATFFQDESLGNRNLIQITWLENRGILLYLQMGHRTKLHIQYAIAFV
jgi:hypothetical protein